MPSSDAPPGLPCGVWTLSEQSRHAVVLEVYTHAAYAYLVEEEDGIVSHVWLFNRGSMPLGSDADLPPSMPADNIDAAAYRPPTCLQEVRCLGTLAGDRWDIYVGARRIASLDVGEPVGRSQFVLAASGLARTP